MNLEVLRKAAEPAEKTGHAFVAGADAAGLRHLAAAGRWHVSPRRARDDGGAAH